MFDIGWSEMAVIALVALIVIGPKDLPKAMKTAAQWMRKARSLTREFQSGIDEMVREAELEDARKALEATRRGNLERTISNAVDPEGEMDKEVRNLEREARRESPDDVADAAAGEEASKAERAAAKMVTNPVSVAPAHSLKPPAADTAPEDKPAGQDTKQSA
ncbi:MAG TPA: Sec-independent protein translocase protein TatB [Kiloniellaceae bacterium]|nr:Sec-independent protein translocase protein TatB [Kiloniellaceae bacterium]